MISQLESDTNTIEVFNKLFSSLDKAKNVLTQTAETVQERTQQAKTSVTFATDRVTALAQQTKDYLTTSQDNTATVQQTKASWQEAIEQTKDSVAQTLQTAGKIKSTTSEAVQSAIDASVNDWLNANPAVLRLVQLLMWATHHPILSLAILLFTIAIAWSLIKVIGRLFESFWLLVLSVPFKASKFLIQSCSQIMGFGGLTIKSLVNDNTKTASKQGSNLECDRGKQQRIIEISARLEALKKEQSELLQEALAILKDQPESEIVSLPQQSLAINNNKSLHISSNKENV